MEFGGVGLVISIPLLDLDTSRHECDDDLAGLLGWCYFFRVHLPIRNTCRGFHPKHFWVLLSGTAMFIHGINSSETFHISALSGHTGVWLDFEEAIKPVWPDNAQLWKVPDELISRIHGRARWHDASGEKLFRIWNLDKVLQKLIFFVESLPYRDRELVYRLNTPKLHIYLRASGL